MPGHLLTQTAAFAAEDNGRGPGEGDLIVEMLAALIEPVNPVALFFEIL
jgi:hypothetical protein